MSSIREINIKMSSTEDKTEFLGLSTIELEGNLEFRGKVKTAIWMIQEESLCFVCKNQKEMVDVPLGE